MRRGWLRYPFSALVGMEELKLALLALVVNPRIGGLLIRGPKGSGKSTAVRALEDLLPEVEVVRGCRFRCDPRSPNLCWECRERLEGGEDPLPTERVRMRVVTLPLSATEDRLVGSLDVEATLRTGRVRFRPGILAEANRNILYVDEINLLPDYLVDDLLDVAASGVNVVEREGVSVEHPAEFVLVGSMNPEEGELRPQLLDRLALSVTVGGDYSEEEREEIVRRNAEFRRDPAAFYERYREEQEELRRRIAAARELLPRVRFPGEMLRAVVGACRSLRVDGVRPDIAAYEAARALAALDGREEVSWDDVRLALRLALSHRTRAGGALEPPTAREIEAALSGAGAPPRRSKSPSKEESRRERGEKKERRRRGRIRLHAVAVPLPIFLGLLGLMALTFAAFPYMGMPLEARLLFLASGAASLLLRKLLLSLSEVEVVGQVRPTASLRPEGGPAVLGTGPPRAVGLSPSLGLLRLPLPGRGPRRGASRGRRAKTDPEVKRGRVRGWRIPRGRPSSVHLSATLRAAAARSPGSGVPEVRPEDVREKLYERRVPLTAIIVLDLSDSMSVVKEEFARSLARLYRELSSRKDRIGLVAVRDLDASVVQRPTSNLRLVARRLESLTVSGLTPLASGLLEGLRVALGERARDPDSEPILVVITDGYANVPLRVNPITGRPGIREFAVSNVQRAQAVEDVAAAALMVGRSGIRTVVLNPDPVASAHRVPPAGAGRLYRECLSGDGALDAREFSRLVSKRYDLFALGSAVSALIAHLTGGSYHTTSSPAEVEEALREAVGWGS